MWFDFKPDDSWRSVCEVTLFCFGVHGVYCLSQKRTRLSKMICELC